jgi:hypothetical protein
MDVPNKRYGIGIDIGYINFALCVIEFYPDENNWKPLWMSNSSIGIAGRDGPIKISRQVSRTLDNIFKKLNEKLKLDFINKSKDNLDVVIESQPKKKLIMERILMSVIDYFTYRGIVDHERIFTRGSNTKYKIFSTINNSSINKKFGRHGRGKKGYASRKQKSVKIGKYILLQSINGELWMDWIDRKFKKQDDLFDALLIILNFMGLSIYNI